VPEEEDEERQHADDSRAPTGALELHRQAEEDDGQEERRHNGSVMTRATRSAQFMSTTVAGPVKPAAMAAASAEADERRARPIFSGLLGGQRERPGLGDAFDLDGAVDHRLATSFRRFLASAVARRPCARTT